MCPTPDFVRTLTTFRSLRRRARRLPLWHGDLRQFCPFQNPSKTEQTRTKTDKNGHQNRKNLSKNSAFCLTYLNIRGPNRPWRPRIKDQRQKKRAFARFGKVKIDVSIMQPAACVGGPRRASLPARSPIERIPCPQPLIPPPPAAPSPRYFLMIAAAASSQALGATSPAWLVATTTAKLRLGAIQTTA